MKNSTTNICADEAWQNYSDYREQHGGSLAVMGERELAEAMRLHAIYVEADDRERLTTGVKINRRAVERAIDSNADVFETDEGPVYLSATMVRGMPKALLELALAISEGADEGAQVAAENSKSPVPSAFVALWVDASLKAARAIEAAALRTIEEEG